MLDRDLAELYGVSTKRLNEQVKRNKERFPERFMVKLTKREFGNLRSHFATLEKKRGKHRKYLPYAFTEQGVSMLSGVLKSDIAVNVSIQIIDAFVSMRKFISKNSEIFILTIFHNSPYILLISFLFINLFPVNQFCLFHVFIHSPILITI